MIDFVSEVKKMRELQKVLQMRPQPSLRTLAKEQELKVDNLVFDLENNSQPMGDQFSVFRDMLDRRIEALDKATVAALDISAIPEEEVESFMNGVKFVRNVLVQLKEECSF